METAECNIQRQTKSTHVGCDEENYAQQTNKQTNAPDTQLRKSPNLTQPDRSSSLHLSTSRTHTVLYSVLFLSVLIYKTAHFVRFCIEIELNFSGVEPMCSVSKVLNQQHEQMLK